MMKTILITGNPDIAADADAAGVSRIMVDLESMGKKDRQASRTTFISSHSKDDIAKVRSVLARAELMVRINPWHEHSEEEIRHAVDKGADIIMLPMITDVMQIHKVLAILPKRVKIVPLVETIYSMERIADIAKIPDVSELYIGLNDLHLALGLNFLFEPLALGLLDTMVGNIRGLGKPYGFGGIAIMGSGELPAERVLAEHERLESTRVILSSRFCRDADIENADGRVERLRLALHAMQEGYARLSKRDAATKKQDFDITVSIVKNIANDLRMKRQSV